MKLAIRYATLETIERRQILRVIRATKGNISQASLILDIDRRTLYRKLEKYYKKRRAEIVVDNSSEYLTLAKEK